nr:MAG TPA: hypothetical protein [Caudoviricetes sp.]
MDIWVWRGLGLPNAHSVYRLRFASLRLSCLTTTQKVVTHP